MSQSGLSNVVQFIVKQFLTETHYSTLHTSLSTRWEQHQSLTAAVKLMEQYGVTISPEEEKRLYTLDEGTMIEQLVSKMPQQTKEQFEHFFLQLQLIVSTATRIRTALEEGTPGIIQEALNDADQTGIMPYILKMSIVQAGAEVIALRAQHETWTAETEARMSKLLRGQDDAMQAQKQLAAAQAQLGHFQGSHKDKAYKAMMGVAGKNDRAAMDAVITNWKAVIDRTKKEAEIRVEYQERIEAAQKRLFDYKQSQKGNAKGVLLRQAAAGDSALIGEVFAYLCKEPQQRKADEEAARKLAEIEAKLGAQAGKNKDNAKAVLMRNLAQGDNMLMDVCLEAWKSWLAEYKLNKDQEDAVKAAEQKVAEFMKSKSEGAKGVIEKMNAATDSGLVEHVISTWIQYWNDLKKAEEMEAILNGANSKFAAFGERNKAGAMSAGQKATMVKEYGLLVHSILLWTEFTKVERMLRYYSNRIDGRKHQLQGLQTMFRNFASQLETGLKDGTPRDGGSVKNGSSKKLTKNSDQSVSLPNIHAHKPPSGRVSNRS